MPEFRKLLLDDIPLLRGYFAMSRTGACDNTVGGMFMWRDYFATEFCICHGTMITKVKYLSGETAFTVPLGGEPGSCLEGLSDYCRTQRIPLVFCTVTGSDLPLLQSRFDLTAAPERDWFDYVYDVDAVTALAGRAYHGQKNFVNSFKKTFPAYSFRGLDREVIPDALAFLDEYYARSEDKGTPVFREEKVKTYELLNRWEEYGLPGGILYTGDGRVASFSVGETVGDTLFIHIEKADRSIRGAYQTCFNEFLKAFAAPGIRYVNREEDVGDEGLRATKLAYHPSRLIQKYTVRVNGQL